jgi:hypothetical protein
MPCLLAALALLMPRVVIVLLVIFSDWIGAAYNTTVWPLLGFIFFPYTTLAYALAMNAHASVSGLYLVIVVLAVLLDLGAMGGGAATKRAPVRVK